MKPDLTALIGLVDHPEVDAAVASSSSLRELLPKLGIVLITLILSGYFSKKKQVAAPVAAPGK